MLKRCLLAIFYYCSFPVALASQSSRMVIEDQKDFYGIDSTIERFFTATPVPPVVYNDDPFMGRRRRSAVPASAPTLHSHTNNWAVLVCTSRFWFNYRHIANTLSVYRTVKRLGIPDSNIILMLADDVACNPRNRYPATVFNNRDRKLDLYGGLIGELHGGTVEVDYRGYDVTVENFIRLLTDRLDPDTPRSKRLLSDDRSNILVYMTGHGGDEFLKFQDSEEISSHDIADAFQQMFEKKRYHELLFIVDTCQANTLYTRFYSPNILAAGSSSKGQNSYSHSDASPQLGVAVIDRYTYYMLDFMERSVLSVQSQSTLADLFNSFQSYLLAADPGVRKDLFGRDLSGVLITDFFGNVPSVQLMDTVYNLSNAAETPISSTADSFIIPPPLPESDEKKTRGESEDGTFDLLVSDWRRLISSGAGFIDSIIEAAKIVICRKHGNFEMLQIHSNPILNVEDSQRLLLSSHPPSTQFAAGATLLVLALLISMRF